MTNFAGTLQLSFPPIHRLRDHNSSGAKNGTKLSIFERFYHLRPIGKYPFDIVCDKRTSGE